MSDIKKNYLAICANVTQSRFITACLIGGVFTTEEDFMETITTLMVEQGKAKAGEMVHVGPHIEIPTLLLQFLMENGTDAATQCRAVVHLFDYLMTDLLEKKIDANDVGYIRTYLETTENIDPQLRAFCLNYPAVAEEIHMICKESL